MFVCLAGTVSAQSSGQKSWLLDFYLGGRLGEIFDFAPEDFGGNGNTKIRLGVTAGLNLWLANIGTSLSIGPAIRFGIAFPKKMQVSYEAQETYYKYMDWFIPSPVTADDGASLLNFDGTAGIGLKAKFTRVFSANFRLGVALYYDSVNFSWDNSMGGKSNLDLGYLMVGVGFDAGARLAVPVASFQVFAELGVGFSYYPAGWDTWSFKAKAAKDTLSEEDRETFEISESKELGKADARKILALGAPYLAIGITF